MAPNLFRRDEPEPPSLEPSAEQLRYRRLSEQRNRDYAEAYRRAEAALIKAESYDGLSWAAMTAWTGVAEAWIQLQQRDRGGLADD